jgi:hypothetical protein
MVIGQKVIYPRRLYFVNNENKCDNCKKKAFKFMNIELYPYLGLWSCENCLNIIKKSIDILTIKYDELVKLYGYDIYVKRSNGEKEKGWRIKSCAFQEKKDGPHWVIVKNKEKSLSKCITLSDIKEWNSN